MTKAELLHLRRAETPKTVRLLELYPDDERDRKPSERSRTALELALTFLNEERLITDLCTGNAATPHLTGPHPQTIADAVAALRESFEANDKVIAAADFDRIVDFFGTRLPLGTVLLIVLLDHIHHRGQFTIYSRLAGARVPRIYGPSADEPNA
ncbi:MAG TPA: DinB family protein [Thermoanaerobaculia bacterium]|nr:DinB family protein [Thermoanaerobaculia bacterium]